jgi:predicted amidophosphoribosyltransferase
VQAVQAVAREFARLALPVACPGCGAWDLTLCEACRATLAGAPVRCEDDVPRLDHLDGVPPLPVWRLAAYAGPVRGIVLAWKDHGRADLTPAVTGAMRRGAAQVAPELAVAAGGRALAVVPVPSTAAARRRRGADLVGLLARAATDGLRSSGVAAGEAPVLVRRPGRRDQAGLGARARGRNSERAVRVRRGPVPGGGLCVLVDDVVTTGSTLTTCEEALMSGGWLVLGAIAVAATPPPSHGRVLLAPGSAE